MKVPMKIALIAMSGIRAENPELMELGMKLPRFLERAQTLFEMPSLSLLTLAGMTPMPRQARSVTSNTSPKSACAGRLPSAVTARA